MTLLERLELELRRRADRILNEENSSSDSLTVRAALLEVADCCKKAQDAEYEAEFKYTPQTYNDPTIMDILKPILNECQENKI